jgi:hypothetical protein
MEFMSRHDIYTDTITHFDVCTWNTKNKWTYIPLENSAEKFHVFRWAQKKKSHYANAKTGILSILKHKKGKHLNYMIHYQYSPNQIVRWCCLQLLTIFPTFGVNVDIANFQKPQQF